MEITTAPHKLLPILLVSTFAFIFNSPLHGPNLTSYDEPGPRSNCYIKVDDPHISKYFLRRGERKVKVNARSFCAPGHRNVRITIEIWKDGRVGSNFVMKFSTNPVSSTSRGILVEMKNASVLCKDLRPTNYFAYAYGEAEVNGKRRKTPIAVTDHLNLKCGT